jgi:putative transcriptional regulator
MLKAPLIEQTEQLLEKNDWATVRYHGCFDIAAKKDGLLLIKLLTNVDAMLEGQASSLKTIAANLDASAILVGENTRRENLAKGVVYERFEVPTVSFETLEQLIAQEIMPRIYRDKGGLYVDIDSAALKSARSRKGLTQRELAEAVGVNKKAIWEHEKRQLRMMLEIAQKLEAVLDRKLVKGFDLLETKPEAIKAQPKDSLERAVGSDLKRLGFGLDFVRGAPFDIFARERALIISDVEANKRQLRKRAIALKEFIVLTKKPAVMITEQSKDDDLSGIPVLPRSELKEFADSSEVIRLAKRAKAD